MLDYNPLTVTALLRWDKGCQLLAQRMYVFTFWPEKSVVH